MTTVTTTVDGLGPLLRVWRVTAGLSLRQLAERVSEVARPVSEETLRRYEQGRFPGGQAAYDILVGITVACGRRLSELPDDVWEDLAGFLSTATKAHYARQPPLPLDWATNAA